MGNDIIEMDIDDLDVVFISYDEPHKDHFWNELQEIYPFAIRVDGVTGFDAAHKEAARQVSSDRFITIDGDTKVDSSFFDMKLKFDPQYEGHVFSWASRNVVNDLVYGNGSIKCWPTESVHRMNTHEATDEGVAQIEFCWTMPYLSMNDHHSVTYPAGTPYHGFRAGFREGVKMAMDQGELVAPNVLFNTIWPGNAHKLKTWASVGADHENGLWCIYGARMGLSMINDRSLDFTKVADYNWFPEFWENEVVAKHKLSGHDTQVCSVSNMEWCPHSLSDSIEVLGDLIYQQTGVYIPLFNAEQSKHYKELCKAEERPTEQVLFPYE